MAKNEPYDRTGLANETFELPHISDREGIAASEMFVQIYSNRRTNWTMIDSFLSLISSQIFQTTRGHCSYTDLCLIQVRCS